MDGITRMMKVRDKGYDFLLSCFQPNLKRLIKSMGGWNMGADDYVTKPFTTMELLARVNSHLRRYSRYLDRRKQSRGAGNDNIPLSGR